MKILTPIMFRFFFCVMLYAGYSENITFALYISNFFLWFIIITGNLIALTSSETRKQKDAKVLSNPHSDILFILNFSLTFVITFFLLNHDAYITGALYLFTMILMAYYRQDCKNKFKEQQA